MSDNSRTSKRLVGLSRQSNGGKAPHTNQRHIGRGGFRKASQLPRGDSATGSLESRIEDAIKQLSVCARQADDEWLVEALAAMVADLERLWAHAAGIAFSGGESA